MKLEQSLIRQLEIEKRIFDNDGEITPLDELEFDAAVEEVQHNVDRAVFGYRRRAEELEYIKAKLREIRTSREQQLETFKNILHACAYKYGKIQSPICSISAVEKTTERVIIWDFDLAMEKIPEAVVIKVEDNVKTITLRKEELKRYYKKYGEMPGFEIQENKAAYPLIRVRTKSQ